MKKSLLLLATVALTSTLLVGCDNEKQTRMESCTQARKTADDRLDGKASEADFLKAKSTWNTLKCTERDIIK